MAKKKITSVLFGLKRIHQVVLLLVPFILYAQTFSFDFSYHDDDTMILNNYQVLQDFDLKKIFFTDAWMLDQKIELYRPWQSLTYAIDNHVSGTKASAYHFHNVLIFCIAIQLLYLFLLALKLDEMTAFLLGLIYSVHFLLAHTVSWIPARGDLYLFAFSMGSLLCYYLYIRTQKPLYILFSVLSYFGALLSKESAMVLLPLIYLTGFLFWNVDLKNVKSYLLLGGCVIVTSLYLWMRSQSVVESENVFTFSGIAYNLPTIPESITKFFVPAFFSVMPAFKTIVTLVGVALMIGIAGLIFYFRQTINKPLVILGIAFFLLPILPSMIYKPAFTDMAYDYLDHRMFFPGLGLLLLAFALAERLVRNMAVKYAYALVAVMFIVSFVNAKNYKNYESYYENATRTNPNSEVAWENYGSSLARENKYDRVFDKFNKAVELAPKNVALRMKIADSYYTLKEYKNMTRVCRQVIAIDPTYAKAYFNIALHMTELKQNDSALALMNTCVQKNPNNNDAYYLRGLIHKTVGNNDSALVDFQRTIQLNPEASNAYFEQGFIYGNQGKYDSALAAYSKYVELNPNDGRGYFYRGQSLCLLKNVADGCSDLHTALNLGITDAQAKIDYYCK